MYAPRFFRGFGAGAGGRGARGARAGGGEGGKARTRLALGRKMHASFGAGSRSSRPDHVPRSASLEEADGLITRFTNCRILRDHELRREDLWVRDGVIVDPQSLFWEGCSAGATIDCGGRIIAPGYIDVQLNGAFGIDFSTPSDLPHGLEKVCKGMLSCGVTAFLPTVITSSPADYRAILPNLVTRVGSASTGASALGIHLEGPFLSLEKIGCHPPQHQRVPDGKPDALRRACGDHLAHVRMVTVAPEAAGARTLVAEMLAMGMVVSAGHSMASSAQMEEAQRWGVTMCTHLFNAMLPLDPQEPGIVGVLGSATRPHPFFGIIADGIHVHPSSLKIAHAARPASLVLVSDQMAAMGLPDGQHRLGEAVVEVVGDRAYRQGTQTLAGAVVPLNECVRRFARFCDCGAVAAIEAATLHPAQCLGIEASKGTLRVGADADLVLLDDELRVRRTYVAGKLGWAAEGEERQVLRIPRLP